MHDDARVAQSSTDFLWSVWTRFEPAADIYAAATSIVRHHLAYKPPMVIDAPKLIRMFPPLNKPPPSVRRLSDWFARKFWEAARVMRSPSVIPPLKRWISVAFKMVMSLFPIRKTLPLEALAVETRVPPLQVRFLDASNDRVTAERFTGIVPPTVRSPREEASSVSLLIVPPLSVICAVPTLAGAVCWIVIVPRSAWIVAPFVTMSLPDVVKVMLPPGPGAASGRSGSPSRSAPRRGGRPSSRTARRGRSCCR